MNWVFVGYNLRECMYNAEPIRSISQSGSRGIFNNVQVDFEATIARVS